MDLPEGMDAADSGRYGEVYEADLVYKGYLLLKKTGSRLHADGVKDDSFYEPKNELVKLGLPEHLILWHVLFCPAVGFIAAGIGTLIR